MRAVIQRVSEASLSIGGEVRADIGRGFVVLLGVEENDSAAQTELIVKKLVAMRIFSDSEDKMNLNIDDISGEILLVSQFTLLADCRKGNRPSFIRAARPETAEPLYELAIKLLREKLGNSRVKTGVFGADMAVSLVNDGPVTILLDTEELERPRRA